MKKKILLFLSIAALLMPMIVFAEDPEPTQTDPATPTDPQTTTPDVPQSPEPTPSATPTEEKIELTLEAVNIPGAKLLTPFSKDASKEYEVEITDKSKFDLTKVTVSRTSKSDKVKFIVSQLDGQNKFRIVVTNTADSNQKLTYTFKVKQEENNANLSSLKINGYAFNEAFSADTTSYTVTIPYDVTTVTITANPEDSNSKVAPGVSFTKDDLKVGGNTVEIKVTNNNTTKVYKIFITRSEESEVSEKATSIISSKINSSEFDIPETENPDSILNYIIITLGTLVLLSIGGIGIYFYVKTSPKKMKKELLKEKEKKEESPIVEAEAESKPKKSDIEEL